MKLLLLCVVIFWASKTAFTYEDESKKISDDMIEESVIRAKGLVDKAYAETQNNLKQQLKREPLSIGDMMAFSKQPTATSITAITKADYLDATLQVLTEKLKCIYKEPFNISDVLTPEQMETINQLTGCAYQYLPRVCPLHSPYRTITGECNNRKNPMLGVSNAALKRLLPAEYENGYDSPKGWTDGLKINGYPLPMARALSNAIVRFNTSSLELDTNRSQSFMQWGQFTDHDKSLSPDTPSVYAIFKGVDCINNCVKGYPCFPLPIPPDDPTKNLSDCIPLFRSAAACSLSSLIRQQINVLTPYHDASQVYGSEIGLATKLRNLTNDLGLLAINQNYTDNGRPFLPFSDDEVDLCLLSNKSAGIPCFLAGDNRVSEQFGITTFHTLFLREHNRFVTELHKLNPSWNGETLYQEARKAIGCMLQKITYNDWLPLLLGKNMLKYIPKYTSYNESEDPRVSNVFTLAFRMGHTLVHVLVYRVGEGYVPLETNPAIPLHRTFYNPAWVIHGGGIDPLMRGMLVNSAKINRQYQIMSDELRDHLFESTNKLGLDLAAINIQRGRDRGLPAYNEWRRYCDLPAPKDVDELAVVLNNTIMAEKLMEMYKTTENIDFWLGAVSEPLVPGGRIGPLLTCIIGDQFRRARDGDRYYYENPSVLSPAQKRSIEKVTLARIICDNTNIKEVPRNIFLGNRYPEDFVPCSSIPQMDLTPWKNSAENVADDESCEPL